MSQMDAKPLDLTQPCVDQETRQFISHVQRSYEVKLDRPPADSEILSARHYLKRVAPSYWCGGDSEDRIAVSDRIKRRRKGVASSWDGKSQTLFVMTNSDPGEAHYVIIGLAADLAVALDAVRSGRSKADTQVSHAIFFDALEDAQEAHHSVARAMAKFRLRPGSMVYTARLDAVKKVCNEAAEDQTSNHMICHPSTFPQ